MEKSRNTLVNVGYGEELDNDLRSSLVNHEQISFTDLRNTVQEVYINEENGILNRKGEKFLTKLYRSNEELREEIINFFIEKKN